MTHELRLSGVVSLRDSTGDVHHLPSARAQMTLARLTIERFSGTTRHQLADTLWPDELPSTWESALRSVVSRVRAFVAAALPTGSNPVTVRSGRYVLTLPDDMVVDIEEGKAALARARAALASGCHHDARSSAATAVTRLQAPLLASHDGDWINRTRERYTDLHVDALETASVAAVALDEHGDALQLANEAARLAPLRESAHRCCINAHVAAGNRAAALRVYHELRKMLADELGVDPSPETEDAYLALLGEGGVASRTASGRVGRRRLATFVGRTAELAALSESWARAIDRDSHVVLVTGETGIGKTRLATEVARRVTADGGRALCVRCDGSMTSDIAPLAEIIESYLAATPDDLLPTVSETTRRVLAQLRSPAGGPLAERVPVPVLRSACTEVLGAAAAEQPLLIVLDDIHLADDHTMWLLRHVVNACANARLLIVATARSDGPRPVAFLEMTDDLERDGRLRRVSLSGLEPGEILELLRHETRDATATRRQPVQRMIVDTAGNAFMLLELIRQCGDAAAADLAPPDPPVAIKEYTRARLSALGQAEHDLLAAASVSGDEFELGVLAEVTGISPSTAHTALIRLRDLGLVIEAGTTDSRPSRPVHHRFVHAVIRRVIYEQLGEAQRRTLHQRCADAIEALHAGDLDQHLVNLTYHRFAAGSALGHQSVNRVCRAANEVHRSGAPREALRIYQDALQIVPADEHEQRAEILARLGHAQHDTGDRDAGHTLLAATIEARRSNRSDIAVDAALSLAVVAEQDDRFRDEATALLDEMLADHGGARGDDPVGVADGQCIPRLDELTAAHATARRIRLGGTVAPGTAALAVCALARELARLGGVDSIERRASLARELHDLAIAADDDIGRLIAAHHLAMVAEITTDRPDVAEAALATLSALRPTAPQDVSGLLAEHHVARAITEGRGSDAIDLAWHARVLSVDDALPFGGEPPGTVLSRQLAVAHCLRLAPRPTGASHIAPTNLVERAVVDLLGGARGTASLTVRALVTGAEPMPSGDEWLHAAGLLGFAAVELGDPVIADATRELLTPVAHLTCCVGYRSFAGPVAFHLGRLDAMLDDWGEAERHLTFALRALGRRRAHPWIAVAEEALARTLHARGRCAAFAPGGVSKSHEPEPRSTSTLGEMNQP